MVLGFGSLLMNSQRKFSSQAEQVPIFAAPTARRGWARARQGTVGLARSFPFVSGLRCRLRRASAKRLWQLHAQGPAHDRLGGFCRVSRASPGYAPITPVSPAALRGRGKYCSSSTHALSRRSLQYRSQSGRGQRSDVVAPANLRAASRRWSAAVRARLWSAVRIWTQRSLS